MDLSNLPILAGSAATTIFVGSYLPMLVRAARTRDLSSYSRSSLVLANVGNLVQTAYVATLPLGPIWGLHAFYLLATLTMLVLHLRHARPQARPATSAETAACAPPPRIKPTVSGSSHAACPDGQVRRGVGMVVEQRRAGPSSAALTCK